MKWIFRHPKKVVAVIVGGLFAVWLQGQGVPAPQAQAVGAAVGEAAGNAAQQIADSAAE